MDDDVMNEAAVQAVAAFTTAVDGLAGLSVTALPGPALIELVSRVATQRRRMAAVDRSLVATQHRHPHRPLPHPTRIQTEPNRPSRLVLSV